jgi:hypothetical protein
VRRVDDDSADRASTTGNPSSGLGQHAVKLRRAASHYEALRMPAVQVIKRYTAAARSDVLALSGLQALSSNLLLCLQYEATAERTTFMASR